MKKIILFIILSFVVVSSAVTAQDASDNKTVRKDRIWKYYLINEGISHMPRIDTTTYCVKYKNDTIINGVKYMQFDCDSLRGVYEYKLILREDNGKVYCYLKNPFYYGESIDVGDLVKDGEKMIGEYLLHDFNLPVGTTYKVPLFETYYAYEDRGQWYLNEVTVKKTQEIELGGENYVLQDIDNPASPHNDVPGEFRYLEGIGPLTWGILGQLIAHGPWDLGYRTVFYVEFCQLEDLDGNVIFSRKDVDKYIGVETVYADRNESDSRMFDLMGREIRNPQPGTLYIRDGRKHIAR